MTGPVVLVATPLEPELVARLRAAAPDAEVLHDPDLLAPPRYPCDHRGDPGFVRSGEVAARWRTALERAEVLLGVPDDTPDGLAAAVRGGCPRLRWVQGTAAGTGELVARAGLTAQELERVAVTSAVGVHAEQLAEWSMLALLAFTKDLPRLLRDKAAHRWDHYPVRELRGQTLLVVGLGHIGLEVARQARCLGMRVVGIRRTDRGPVPEVDQLATLDELPALVPDADAVVLALPRTRQTEGLFDAALIGSMKPHAVLVNVGRGAVVDEPALVEALAAGALAGAGLEVFATEPLPADSPLWDLDNVLISPHTAALSVRENERIVELFADNLRRWQDGEPLRNRVDSEHLY